MNFYVNTPISKLVEGGSYLALVEGDWGVYQFRDQGMWENGERYDCTTFERIGGRVYTPEEADAQDRELNRLRAFLSVISIETAYSADTLEEATDTIVTVEALADMALDGSEVPLTGTMPKVAQNGV